MANSKTGRSHIVANKELDAEIMYMHTNQKSCIDIDLISDFEDWIYRDKAHPEYAVLASVDPELFCMGGDLDYFISCIRSKDINRLESYARRCVTLLARFDLLEKSNCTTISVIRGKAYGGGFECALSANTIIVEENAEACFPEQLFGLFPGMGAYRYLKRRMGHNEAVKFINSGKRYSGEELFAWGIADVLAPAGRGLGRMNDFIIDHKKKRKSITALSSTYRNSDYYVKLKDLYKDVNHWVDAAIHLSDRDIRMMQKIANKQKAGK